MPYVEFAPRPDLAHIVKCIWNYEAPATETIGRPERIVPDGNPELVIHYGHPFAEFATDGEARPQPRAFVMGQMTRPLALNANEGLAGVLGVRFHPHGARALIGAAMDEFVDCRLTLSDLANRSTERLVDEIANAPGARARADILERFVASLAGANARHQDNGVTAWTNEIARVQGRLSISKLASDAGLSLRQFERRFRSQVGVSPRLYANVIRFRTVFDSLSDGTRHDWARLALSAGYFDQSHMIRDFRRFLGCSPNEFLAELRGLSAVLVGLDEETPCRVVTRREARP